MTTRPTKQLDTFPNPQQARDFHIAFECPEFTCLCPMTGQPDFATIHIDYVPDQLCVELKSLKLYLWSYRDEGAFHEAVTNRICDDIVAATSPRQITVTGKFWMRGGITTTVTVTAGSALAPGPALAAGSAAAHSRAVGASMTASPPPAASPVTTSA